MSVDKANDIKQKLIKLDSERTWSVMDSPETVMDKKTLTDMKSKIETILETFSEEQKKYFKVINCFEWTEDKTDVVLHSIKKTLNHMGPFKTYWAYHMVLRTQYFNLTGKRI